ncbi:LytR/AlgR family response regulator transcription factor [Foetidibacter luteolus]|uniref:LytR/AlgR family response regulator transcription factor n=1 Tax=Foetidibacter luteolus TaxID=2608880 RepID=UPI00129BCF93|nr:LytTR family DNA-binding domain-containing protein [Foetidibacter luteolus]
MITTILVDDELRLLSSLSNMIELYCPQLTVTAMCDNPATAIDKIKTMQPGLVFLDISLPGKTAFDLLREIGDINFAIIFVTAHNNYMEQAFKFSAIDYLLKPVDEEDLVKAVHRAVKRVEEQSFRNSMASLLHNMQKHSIDGDPKLCIPILNGFEMISVSEIVFCEADGAYTNFHLTSGKKLCASRPLLDYELLLQDKMFTRIHKSYLINTRYIKKYIKGEGGTVVMNNGSEISVSRRKKELFLEMIRENFHH